MKYGFGCFLMAVGLVLAAYCSLWLCFIGGIVQVIEGAQALPVNALAIALGILRVLATGFVAYISLFVFLLPGMVMVRGKL